MSRSLIKRQQPGGRVLVGLQICVPMSISKQNKTVAGYLAASS